MEKKLDAIAVIKNGVEIGLKNMVPILVNVLLWVLTIWIPYLNIGTTIGLAVGIVAKASRGEAISMTEIFDPKYRKYMGEFFLTGGLVMMGTMFGYMLFIIPGIVISIAWMFATILAVDKGKNPTDAIMTSNNVTYGNKGRMFLAFLVLTIVYIVAVAIFSRIPVIGPILVLAAVIVVMFASVGMQAYCYKELCENA